MSWIYAGLAAAAAIAGHLWAIARTGSPASLFEIWRGQSATGFTAGTLLTIVFILWRFGSAAWRYLDALGVRFPGGTRFDLRLLEALLAVLAGAARICIAAVSESSSAFTAGFGGIPLALLGGAVLVSRAENRQLHSIVHRLFNYSAIRFPGPAAATHIATVLEPNNRLTE